MKHKIFLTVGLFFSLSGFAANMNGPGDVGSVVLRNSAIKGYKCSVKKGSLVVTGGESSPAKTRFSQLKEVAVLKEKTLWSGQLIPIAKGSLEFNSSDSLSVVDGSTMYATVQETRILDKTGEKQLKTETELESDDGTPLEIIAEYSHIYRKEGAESEELVIKVSDQMITDHKKFLKGSIQYKYVSPASLPPEIQQMQNGTMTAQLVCKDRN